MAEKMEDALYRKKVLSCWLGKSIGGTLGAPVEGWDGPLNLSFYDPVPSSMLPNDDLDLQVVWACTLAKMETPIVDSRCLAKAWQENVDFSMDEYGVAKRNLSNQILPPFSGSYDNWFTDGMGAAIRSELWACLAPGDPQLAAGFAYEDACVDHAGSGLWAEVFLAAMESAAFVEPDVRNIVEAGKNLIPRDCPLRTGVEDVIRWYDQNPSFDYLFEQIMAKYKSDNFTDVKVNLPIIVAGLLLGNGDFSKSICHAVNFGEDCDCTGATVGAIMGILNPDGIGGEWLRPIGRNLVLSKEIVGITPPATLDDFSDMICNMRPKVKLQKNHAAGFTPRPIKALYGLRRSGKPGEPTIPVTFAGQFCRWPEPLENMHQQLVLQFRFRVPAAGDYAVMFNTKAQVQVWVDGTLAFQRQAGGAMAPSFHRVPWNQSAVLRLTAGWHELKAVLQRMPDNAAPDWVVGVGYAGNTQWVPDAFELA